MVHLGSVRRQSKQDGMREVKERAESREQPHTARLALGEGPQESVQRSWIWGRGEEGARCLKL